MNASFRWGLIGVAVAAGVATLAVSQWPWANAAHHSTLSNESPSKDPVKVVVIDPSDSMKPNAETESNPQDNKADIPDKGNGTDATANVAGKSNQPPAPPNRNLPPATPPPRKSYRDTVRFEKGSEPAEDTSGRPRNITFDDLKFPWEDPKSRFFKRAMLTESIEKMNGKKVKVRGFILPTSVTNLRGFILVRDNMECCFGPGAALYDNISVEMVPGTLATYTIRPVAVEGTLTIKELIAPDGKHLSIYHIEATEVQ